MATDTAEPDTTSTEWLAERLLGTKWQETAHDQQLLRYLEELTELGLDSVKREPEKLEEQSQRLHRQLQDLAFTEYKSFIQTAECSKNIRDEFYQINGHLAGLIDRLPRLREQCEDFLSSVGEISAKQKANSLVLQYHSQLLELLEIPQLMDTCVRNGYYEEALDLEAHVNRLRTRFESNTIIQSIADDVTRSSEMMLSQLVALLQTDIKLPMCLRVSGFLRRMGRFSDAELRMVFLRARDTHLANVLASLPTIDAFAYMKKYLDVSRDHVFDIITQFRAIFAETGYNGVLHGWSVHKVSSMLTVLERNIAVIHDGAALSTLLSQAMYFGMSLGRAGVDFRGLLIEPFERAIYDLTAKYISNGTEAFVEAIKTRRWIPQSSSSASPLPTFVSGTDDTVMPPAPLVEHATLGALCNAYVAAFNELRQMPAVTIVVKLSLFIETQLNVVVTDLVNVHALKRATMRTDEGKAFAEFCKAAAELFVPFVQRGLIALYPTHAAMIEDKLDVRKIVQPLRPLFSTIVARSSVKEEAKLVASPITNEPEPPVAEEQSSAAAVVVEPPQTNGDAHDNKEEISEAVLDDL